MICSLEERKGLKSLMEGLTHEMRIISERGGFKPYKTYYTVEIALERNELKSVMVEM